MVKQFFYTAFLFLASTNLLFAELTAQVDRKTVRIDETLMLTIKSDKPLTRTPDLNEISEALQPISQMQFSNTAYKNGKRISESGWKIQLLAVEEGVVTIPSFEIEIENTTPIQITILKANRSDVSGGLDPLFTEVSVSEVNPFIQQQIILTVKISSDSDIDNSQLVPPQINNALVRSLGEPTEYVSRLSGKLYRIREYKFSIFPQQEGIIKIAPMLFQGNKIVRYRSRNPLSLLSSQSRTVRIRTEGITLDVKPAKHSQHTWLPASNFKLTSYWRPQPQQLTVGEPITRVLEIEAEGLDATQLTEFVMPEINGISWFPNPAERDNFFDGKQISSKLTQRFALMPNKPGSYTLPAIEFHWFNIDTNKFEVSRIDSQEIMVNPTVVVVDEFQNNASEINSSLNITENLEPKPQGNRALSFELNLWKILALSLLVLWLLSAIVFFLSRRKKGEIEFQDKTDTTQTESLSQTHLTWKQLASHINNQTSVHAYKMINEKIKSSPELDDYDHLINCLEQTELAKSLTQLSKDAFSKHSTKGFDSKLCKLLAMLPEQIKNQTNPSKKDKIAPLYK